MKNIILVLIAPVVIVVNLIGENSFKGCTKNYAQPSLNDSLILAKLKSIDKSRFINQPVDSFLKQEEISKFNRYYFIDEPIGVFRYMAFEYSRRIRINIVVKEYKYFKKDGPTYKDWKIEDFKRETISSITLEYQGEIVQNVRE